MAEAITVSDVNEFCPASKGVADNVVNLYISLSDQADDCLDAKNTPADIQKLLKLSLVCHMLTRKSGGQVKSQSDFDGASVSFAVYEADGYGLASTTYGQGILSTGYGDCFGFANKQPSQFIRSVGRGC